MTDAERIAFLEAELSRERQEKERLLAIVESLTTPKKRSSGAERQARYRERHANASGGDVTAGVTVTSRVTSPVTQAPSPPLDGPPLSSRTHLSPPLYPLPAPPASQEPALAGPPVVGESEPAKPGPRAAPPASSPRAATQAALVDVPASPAATKPGASKTTPEEREAKSRLMASYEELRSEAYPWTGEDWGALRKCLGLAGSDVELLDERWRHGLELGTTWPGVSKLRELASKWGHLGNHLASVGKGTRDVRQERQAVGGDVPRIPGMDRLYRSGQG